MENQGGVADSKLANIAILVLGGSCVSFFMSRFLRKMFDRVTAGRSREVIAKAGLYGMAATICTFELFFLLFAAYAAIQVALPSPPSDVSVIEVRLLTFVFFLLDIQLEGTILLTWSLPFAFALSSFLGVAIYTATKKRMTPDQTGDQKPPTIQPLPPF